MEFQAIVDFFKSLSFNKRKYPMILSYNKYLQKLDTEQTQNEIILFRRFLTQNPNINISVLTNPAFKTGKKNLTLLMDNFITGSIEQTKQFWLDLQNIDLNLFIGEKPSEEEFNNIYKPSSINKVMTSLENNPMFADVVDQIRSSVDNVSDITNVGAIMEMPDFRNMVENIRGGLSSGKYKLKDLTNTVNTVIASVQDDFDPNTRNTLKTVTDTMEAVERGEPPDVGKLMSAMQTLKLDNTEKTTAEKTTAEKTTAERVIKNEGASANCSEEKTEQRKDEICDKLSTPIVSTNALNSQKLQQQIETELIKLQNITINETQHEQAQPERTDQYLDVTSCDSSTGVCLVSPSSSAHEASQKNISQGEAEHSSTSVAMDKKCVISGDKVCKLNL